MLNRPWVKFPTGFIHDPKIRRLTINERYAMVCLILLAATNQGNSPGEIDLDDGDLAFTLESQLEDWLTMKAKLKARGLIDFSNTRVLVIGWEDLQANTKEGKEKPNTTKRQRKPEDPAKVNERMRRYRQKRRENKTVTAPVTAKVTDVTAKVTAPVTAKNTVTFAVTRRPKSALNDCQEAVSSNTVAGRVTAPVTAKVTAKVTGVTPCGSNALPEVVSGDFVTAQIERKKERKIDLKYTDQEGAFFQGDQNVVHFQSSSIESLSDPSTKVMKYHPAIGMEVRLSGVRPLPRYRTSWGVNGINQEFLNHIKRYLESLPSCEKANLAMAKSWIVRREYAEEGQAMIAIQEEDWIESLSQPRASALGIEVEGKANRRLVDRYQSALNVALAPTSIDGMLNASDVMQSLGYEVGGEG